jgi:hypothetical protein
MIMGLILFNTLCLALEHHDQEAFEKNWHEKIEQGYTIDWSKCDIPEERPLCGWPLKNGKPVAKILAMPKGLADFLEMTNLILTGAFTIEMLLKMIAYGLKKYFSEAFNTFDAVIVVLSIVEITTNYIQTSDGEGGGGAAIIGVFRIFRVFRVFKLARSWKSFYKILMTLQATLKSIFPLAIVLVLFIFIFSLLGMQFFGGKFNASMRNNFDAINPIDGSSGSYGAFVTVFQILTGENWNEIMYEAMKTAGDSNVNSALIFLYFFLFIFGGNYLIFNLFLAILLAGNAPHQNRSHVLHVSACKCAV